MRETPGSQNIAYYNEFVDLHDLGPLKSRYKMKNSNIDNIKVTSKKLPPDFFRPYTRENTDSNVQHKRQKTLKTPCFGDDKKETCSLTNIPKEKRNLDLEPQRMATLPIQEPQGYYKAVRKNYSRDMSSNNSTNDQLSYRQAKKAELIRSEQEKSTQRQKIKYKKLTLNDEVYFDERKILSLQYENRTRLNVRKFFREEADPNPQQLPNKGGKKIVQAEKMLPLESMSMQLQNRSRTNPRLPPL